jgi:hypothetical protein
MLLRVLAIAVVGFLISAGAAFGEGPAGEFTATAEIETGSGTRSLEMKIVVSSLMTREEAKPFKRLLKDRGQWGLATAIRGGSRGTFRLGALDYPIDLVVAEKILDGYRYFVVTTRPLEFEEVRQGKGSLDNPFTVAVFDVPGSGSGQGQLFTRAALSIDADGHVRAEQYKKRTGTLKDVTRR